MSDFSNERKKMLQSVRHMPPGIEALYLLRKLREDFDWAIDGYRNALKTLKDTLYEDRKHFILELIQNADDAQFSHVDGAELKFVLHHNSIELLYNEEGFNVEDVIAITDTGVSTKLGRKNSAHSFIGEKGIGFKSVFALASEIEIESPPWHFALKSKNERFIIPKPIKHGKLKEGDGTRLKIKFFNQIDIDGIAVSINDLIGPKNFETILFLQRISRFTIEDHRQTPIKIHGIYLKPFNRSGESLKLNFINSDYSYEYALYHEDIDIPENLAKGRWEKLVCDGPIKRRLLVAGIMSKPEAGGTYKGRLFCYLPTKIELPVPIFLQIDGLTKADRERLYEPENGWNKHLLELIPEFLKHAIEKWRNHPIISNRLPEFIPISEEADQLTNVFSKFINVLKKTSWVKTYDEEKDAWSTPDFSIRADSFWTKWFLKEQAFRRNVENQLHRKFVHPDWAKNPEWKSVWKYYDVELLNVHQIAGTILPEVDLPKSLLSDDMNLIEFYELLLSWDDRVFLLYSDELSRSPIYPFEGGKRESLVNDNGESRVYWLSVKSKRSTGLENLFDYRIIDQKYTYSPKASPKASKNSKLKISRKAHRNEIVRRVLKRLNVEELDEDKIQELQINWLLNHSWEKGIKNKTPYDIFLAIFESFSAKKSQEDEDYLSNLLRLSSAIFPSEEGSLREIKDMILPMRLRLNPKDRTFESTGFQTIKLSDAFFDPPKSVSQNYRRKKEKERILKRLETLRMFLISCGICNKLKFEKKETTYSGLWDFESSDQSRHDLFQQLIGNDYTWGNHITIKTMELNASGKKILQSSNYDEVEFSKLLYELWRSESDVFDYYHQPDHFVAEYLRYQHQKKSIKDHLWAGVERSIIPLVTLNNEIIKADNAIRISESDLQNLKISRSFFPLVLETESPLNGYDSTYLNSLQVRSLEIEDLNSLWLKGDTETDIILSIAIEFSKINVDMTGLKLFDKNEKILRPATEWVISGGFADINDMPLIDVQYGEIGYKLGIILNLSDLKDELKKEEGITYTIDSDIKSELISIYGSTISEESSSKLLEILERWKNRSLEARRILSYESHFALSNKTGLKKPIVVFNNPLIARSLKDKGFTVFELTIYEKDRFIYCDAVRDLGLETLEDAGKLSIEDKSTFNDDEKKRFDQIVKLYIESLDVKEKYRFDSKFRDLGNPKNWSRRIVKSDNSKKILTEGVIINVQLPFFDGEQFIVSKKENPEEIFAHLLSSFDFTRFKSALNEIEEIEKNKTTRSEYSEKNHLEGQKTESIENIREKHRQGLKDDRETFESGKKRKDWKLGLTPEEEAETRQRIGGNFVESIKKGPEIYEKKHRKRLHKKSTQNIVDPDAFDPKAFLLEEYDGKCQICKTELLLSNGKKWIEIFRIVESRGKNWWTDRPFNILGLCPNCHAVAKYGGGCDFTNIEKEAQNILNDWTWAREVPEYGGDYYVVDVRINGQNKKLVMGKLHLNHVAALYENA